jgi:uncharacterized protein
LTQPDFEQARLYALRRLETELPPARVYHNVAHTRDDVVPAVERLAAMEGLEGEALLVLRTAAYFHDIGFVEQGNGHEAIGARMAAQVLPRFGYTAAQIEIITGIIMATRLPQSPRNLLEEIAADADLDVLGRDDFLARNQDLRDEMAAFSEIMSDEEWYTSQWRFLRQHRYFTASARASRARGTQGNAAALADYIVQRWGSQALT